MRRRVYRWSLDRSDSVVVSTETQREDLADLDEAAAEQAEMVACALSRHRRPPSLDLGRRRKLLGMTSEAVIVGCVVDDLRVEGLELFLDAAAELCMEYPSLEFALIGRDVDNRAYHDLTHERGLLGATVFVDPYDRFYRAISALNVLVTPQRGWPSGMLALQALSADVGVIGLEGGEVAEMLGHSPYVTIVPADGTFTPGQGIIRQLRAASERMGPEHETPESATVSSWLVSEEFYDLDEAWETPGHGVGENDEDASGPELAASFDPTRSARGLIAIYQRLLDEESSG
jgi:glycosyltransferase involved in cell wall biosynthesis